MKSIWFEVQGKAQRVRQSLSEIGLLLQKIPIANNSYYFQMPLLMEYH